MKVENIRVTADAVQKAIKSTAYYNFPQTTTTACLITLKNGFSVLGESACVHPMAFDAQLGRDLAHADAKRKISSYMAYGLCQALEENANAFEARFKQLFA